VNDNDCIHLSMQIPLPETCYSTCVVVMLACHMIQCKLTFTVNRFIYVERKILIKNYAQVRMTHL